MPLTNDCMRNKIPVPTDICLIVTYRCPMRCSMCNIWQHPTLKEKEITPAEIGKLPRVKFINITGGEPFVREDLPELIEAAYRKAPRVVISTSGWYEERVIEIARRFPRIGIRISIEGLSQKNDELRGREGGFDKGLRTLLRLREMGLKDIGFGITVSNHNSEDMLSLYRLSRELGMEFATAALHNSYYFHKSDNRITDKETVCGHFARLIDYQLKEKHPKSWFRAYFNRGLIRYIQGKPRMLPCCAGRVNFFVDPYGEIYPCNGLEEKFWKESMGNIRTASSFEEIWKSMQAERVRQLVNHCPKQCWMVGTASPMMKKHILRPLKWIAASKLKNLFNHPYNPAEA